jgi:hypothetical protein
MSSARGIDNEGERRGVERAALLSGTERSECA